MTRRAAERDRKPTRVRGGARGARQGRGRAIVALGLALFVLAGAAAVTRRSIGIAHARTLRALAAREAQLTGERAAMRAAVRLAAARARVGSVAEERLGMRVPSDTQLVLVARGPAAATAR